LKEGGYWGTKLEITVGGIDNPKINHKLNSISSTTVQRYAKTFEERYRKVPVLTTTVFLVFIMATISIVYVKIQNIYYLTVKIKKVKDTFQ
jgi:hypothetical protein